MFCKRKRSDSISSPISSKIQVSLVSFKVNGYFEWAKGWNFMGYGYYFKKTS